MGVGDVEMAAAEMGYLEAPGDQGPGWARLRGLRRSPTWRRCLGWDGCLAFCGTAGTGDRYPWLSLNRAEQKLLRTVDLMEGGIQSHGGGKDENSFQALIRSDLSHNVFRLVC